MTDRGYLWFSAEIFFFEIVRPVRPVRPRASCINNFFVGVGIVNHAHFFVNRAQKNPQANFHLRIKIFVEVKDESKVSSGRDISGQHPATVHRVSSRCAAKFR